MRRLHFNLLSTSVHRVKTQTDKKTDKSNRNILNLSESTLNLLKKWYLIQKTLDFKEKVFVDVELNTLYKKNKKLTESMSQIAAENKNLQSDLVIINHRL